MSNIVLKINSVEEMQDLAYTLTNSFTPGLTVALNGDLGAGKTTFTKGIGRALGIKRVINSPTFTIMKMYEAQNKVNGIEALYHFDVYRLDDSMGDFELEEYFYLNGVSIIEWATIIDDILPPDAWYIDIYRLSDTTRKVEIKNIEESLVNKLGEKYEVIHG